MKAEGRKEGRQAEDAQSAKQHQSRKEGTKKLRSSSECIDLPNIMWTEKRNMTPLCRTTCAIWEMGNNEIMLRLLGNALGISP